MLIDSEELIKKLIEIRDTPAEKGQRKKYKLNYLNRNRISADIRVIQKICSRQKEKEDEKIILRRRKKV